ncbi:MAG: hypothetical protein M3O06_02295, partial [Pseudomonadota bacterium]|nr:hypothetical protein [Pseudomonadota bacterium]
TRLRVAKSLVGEEHYFNNLDRATNEAKLKRDVFRCATLSDLDACREATSLSPDDPATLLAAGDAYARLKRPSEALGQYRRAAALLTDKTEVVKKINAAEAQLAALGPAAPAGSPTRISRRAPVRTASSTPVRRRYTNAAPDSSSH